MQENKVGGKMKVIKVENAVGTVLCHDITKIVPGEFKGVGFKKGHVIQEEDIMVLKSLGKEHIYVWEEEEGILHENDAAARLRDLACGAGLSFSEPSEGKITIYAEMDGILKIDVESLYELNCLGEMILSTIYNHTVIKKGDKVAATRIIPLTIEEEKIKKAEQLIKHKIIEVKSIEKKKVAIVTTGNEVYSGRIKDASLISLQSKFDLYNCEILGQTIVPDNLSIIEEAINNWLQKGAEMIVCTGGMSVDPDDVTPTAIKNTGAKVMTYGSPVLPGAMFVLAYKGDIPIMGLPAGVIFSKRSVFDLILPRVLAGEQLTHHEIAAYGHGGLL